MNILITGATGFVGSHLLHRLLDEKHSIHIMTRSTSNIWRIKDVVSKVCAHEINNVGNIQTIFDKCQIDIIMHLSTLYIKSEKSWQEIQDIERANIIFPSVLVQLAAENNVKAFINTGTCFEYKLLNEPLSEKSEILPYNFYASTKVAFENILKYYSSPNRLKSLTLKLFYPYGEMDNKKIIPLIIQSFITGKPLQATLGEQQLNFTYVGDIVDAYINAVNYLMSANYKGYEDILIGTNETHSPKEISKNLEEILKRKSPVSFTSPYPTNDILYMSCNNVKAKKTLGWIPKTKIIDGLKRTYEYYKNVV